MKNCNIYLLNKFLNLNIFFNDCFFLIDNFFINKLFNSLLIFFNINKYINVTLVNKCYILYLNNKFNNNNNYTDVLSFKYFNPIKYNLLGDIIICPKILLIKCLKENKNYNYYFLYILTHSFLHLINFDHYNNLNYKKMRFFEKFFLYLI